MSPVIVAVVSALLTVCAALDEVGLALKFVSPLYVAVIVFAPSEALGKLQLVAGKVIVQLFVPSVTVIVPVGVPLPGELTATVALTV